ncbi:helix loop helix DNA-binding domain protein [Ceratobasidium sp. AG-Ba]|nr:helix loop helix DNA-binding domain protein [Ceratobasidium sp. AG-Ba]QRW03424.1 helix loop helix DNA-binding domain protein [Ceratobasidium sp. AG-Ba]
MQLAFPQIRMKSRLPVTRPTNVIRPSNPLHAIPPRLASTRDASSQATRYHPLADAPHGFCSLRLLPGSINPPESSSPISPGLPSTACASNLVHRQNRATHIRSMDIRSTESPGHTSASSSPDPLDLSASEEEGAPRAGSYDLDVRRLHTVRSEQRRRNDLRGGFARLKDALPVSYEKCSKLALLNQGEMGLQLQRLETNVYLMIFDPATRYIGQLEAMLQEKGSHAGTARVCESTN